MTALFQNPRLRFFSLVFLWAPVFLSCTKTTSQMSVDTSTALPPADTTKIDSTTRHYLALGDSYTIGQSVPVTERYPVQLVEALRRAGYNMAGADIVATSGWTTTDLLGALDARRDSLTYELVTLLIGVNNQYQGGTIPMYKHEFTRLLQTAIKAAGGRPERVVVLSIPDYSVTPFATNSDRQKIAMEIDSFNYVNKQISQAYQVHYLDVTGESRKAVGDKTLIAYDGLHFSGKEYTIWTNLLLPVVKGLLK